MCSSPFKNHLDTREALFSLICCVFIFVPLRRISGMEWTHDWGLVVYAVGGRNVDEVAQTKQRAFFHVYSCRNKHTTPFSLNAHFHEVWEFSTSYPRSDTRRHARSPWRRLQGSLWSSPAHSIPPVPLRPVPFRSVQFQPRGITHSLSLTIFIQRRTHITQHKLIHINQGRTSQEGPERPWSRVDPLQLSKYLCERARVFLRVCVRASRTSTMSFSAALHFVMLISVCGIIGKHQTDGKSWRPQRFPPFCYILLFLLFIVVYYKAWQWGRLIKVGRDRDAFVVHETVKIMRL